MGLFCEILINKPREGFHRPGSKVSGIVKFVINKPTEYETIVLSFIGKGKCRWQVTKGSGITQRTITYTGTEEYFSKKINIIDNNVKTVFKPGSYVYPFEFLLPFKCPSSYKDKTCTIKYEMQIEFAKPSFFSFNKKLNTVINVQGYVNPTMIEGKALFGLEKKLLKLFSSKDHIINLKAAISNTIFSAGETAVLEFTVTNDSDVKLTSIKTELIENVVYTAKCGKQKLKTLTYYYLTTETHSVAKNAIANMSTTVPILRECYSIQNSSIISRTFKLKVTVRLPIPHTNDSVKIPIVIGDRLREVNTVPAEECLENAPPSYWGVMNEDKMTEHVEGSGSSQCK